MPFTPLLGALELEYSLLSSEEAFDEEAVEARGRVLFTETPQTCESSSRPTEATANPTPVDLASSFLPGTDEPEAEVPPGPIKWSANEDAELRRLCGIHGEQAWATVAAELGTKRTASVVCVRSAAGWSSSPMFSCPLARRPRHARRAV